MDRKKLTLVTTGILAAFSFTSSFAALNIYSNAIESAADANNEGNYIFNQQGLSSEETSVVSGFGKNMPLDLSLKIIIPSDWKVTLNEAAAKMPVDWQGKTTWPYILENLAKDQNLQVDVNWTKRTVNVFSKEAEEKMLASKEHEIKVATAKKAKLEKEAKAAAKKAADIRKAVKLEEKRVAKEKEKLAVAKKYASLESKIVREYKKENPGVNPTIRQIYSNSNVLPLDRSLDSFVKMTANKTLKEHKEAIYILQPERMLSDNLTDWANANNWDLKWTASADFKILRKVEMKGTLLNNVDHVINLYKNSRKPIMVTFYTKNKVIKVEDFSYAE